ncbi:MAG: virulence protein RhuM/Fic/DOC family protein [Roseburia sp.]|nr:virulence protein RhuM/Fic/DOC family protein [Roseburia sp.]
MDKNNKIVLFTDNGITLEVPITPEKETVWLTQDQMSVLFDTARSSIAYHIGNIFREGELEKDTSVEIFDGNISKASRPPQYYNLDVIISVGYRVKSRRGVAFRKWANSVLKQYILQGYAVNNNRINQLGEVIRIMKRTENSLDSRQVLSVIEKYNTALELLDSYDHQNMKRPNGSQATYVLSYKECREVIANMRFGNESELFGKAANLLYFVTKNHSFYDGNKRIAAAMFLYFLDKNNVLFYGEEKLIDDHTLVALTIMIAESRPEEKEMMISVIMNCIQSE